MFWVLLSLTQITAPLLPQVRGEAEAVRRELSAVKNQLGDLSRQLDQERSQSEWGLPAWGPVVGVVGLETGTLPGHQPALPATHPTRPTPPAP